MFARKMHTLLPSLKERTFVALDFETADHGADSACAIGIVRVENLRIVAKEAILIRPPRSRVMFTHVHRSRSMLHLRISTIFSRSITRSRFSARASPASA